MRDGGAGRDGLLGCTSAKVDVLERFDVETFRWCVAYVWSGSTDVCR